MTAYLDGIDVSAHNGVYSTAGQDFVFIRACYGVLKDTRYDQHFAQAKAAGVVTGAYCFGRNMDATDQADRLLEIGGACDYLFLDREADAGHPTMTVPQARTFIRHLHDKGRRAGLYASESGYPSDAFGADYRWVANYSRKPSIPWNFWQYSGTSLDRNYFDGTLDQLRALAGTAPGQPPASAGEPMTNLFPLTARRVVDLPKGTVLQKTPGGPIYTTLGKPATLGLLGATGTHFQVADGDYGVYVARAGLVPRTEDKNVGA